MRLLWATQKKPAVLQKGSVKNTNVDHEFAGDDFRSSRHAENLSN
jgi:hypothetical protein